MTTVARGIETANASIGNTPFRTVVFYGVMSNSTGKGANPASLYQLRGVRYAQQQQNRGNPKFKIRVLLVNAADDFQAGATATQLIINQIKSDNSIVAVLGIGQSRTFSLNAVQALGKLKLPVIGTSVTGDEMVNANFFRVSPTNARQAQLAANFAKGMLNDRKVLVLANQNEYITGENKDLYSDNLAAWFNHYFADSSHEIIETCHYGEQENPAMLCGGHRLTIPELRDRICGEKPDLIFFAARAITLPQLFTARGGTCKTLPPVMGSSDVPKYIDTSALQADVSNSGSQLYYLSFAPAKLGGCSSPKPYQTKPMCEFLSSYRTAYPPSGSSINPDNDGGLSYDSSDAMLGYDALQTIIQVINVTGNPRIDGAGVLRELDSGNIAFTGASGHISFSANDQVPPYHPVYMTELNTKSKTLTLQISCGKFSDSSAAEGGYCPTVR